MKIEIKHYWDSKVLFSAEIGSLKLALETAVESGADLTSADLTGAYLTGAKLKGANLTGAYLKGAYLSDANLKGANLKGANLTGAYLSDAYLSDANLKGANLKGAYLSDANLKGANLKGADLTGADLSGANLTGAYLTGAYLSDANLTGANGINKNLCTPLRILLEQPGKIRAYKLVNSENEGPYNGGIKYIKGKRCEVKNAETSEEIQCAEGISLATLDWCMREWRDGYKILVAEFTAKDIAAIPTATDGKFRVFRCKIVGEKDLKEIGVMK